jgi:hypothetical protein
MVRTQNTVKPTESSLGRFGIYFWRQFTSRSRSATVKKLNRYYACRYTYIVYCIYSVTTVDLEEAKDWIRTSAKSLHPEISIRSRQVYLWITNEEW